MKPGDLVHDLEGADIGDQGATVVSVDDEKLTILVLDTKEQLTVPLPDADQVASEAPVEGTGVVPHDYDPSAINSPEVTNIRRLPTWWGPRDPNNPSSLTDVMWRPSPYWRRSLQRHYGVEEGAPVKFRYFNYVPINAAAAQERIAALWPRLAAPQPRYVPIVAGRGRRSAYKSKKKLFAFLEAEGAPLRSHSDETYGNDSMIYLDWPDAKTRRDWEQTLSQNGFKVHPDYSPNSATSEVQVSYFKGRNWDE